MVWAAGLQDSAALSFSGARNNQDFNYQQEAGQ
jgi:hypothetical protein